MQGIKRITAIAGIATVLAYPASAQGLSDIDQSIRERLYDPAMIDSNQPVGPSVYADFVAKNPPPWTIGYASSYAGNTWRAATIEQLRDEIIPKWKSLGLLEELIITQSNLDDEVQATQMRELVDQGVDAIIVCCSNPVALNETVKYAYDQGVPTFSFTGYLESEYAINSSVNYHLAGFQIGRLMAEEIGGEGNVLVVEGIPGTSASDSQDQGVKAGLRTADGITVVNTLPGMWTGQIAQGEVHKWLRSYSGQLDGVVVQSSGEMGVLRALAQSDLAHIPVAIGGELGALCYWRRNPDFISGAIQTWPPQDDIALIWDIMMRTLQGQGPKIQSVLVDPVEITFEDLKNIMGTDCDPHSSKWLSVGKDRWGSPGFLDSFFYRPSDPTRFQR